MTIDEQKLLQWVEDKRYVYSGPYEDVNEEKSCVGVLNILRVLKREIELGELDADAENKAIPMQT